MPGEPIIDLDYADVLEEQERPPRTMAAHLRMAAAVSLVLACLLLLGGADLPPRGFSSGNSRTSVAETVGFDPATGQKLWRVEDEVRRVGDLFMASGDAPDGGQIARVYRSLPDGLLWTTPPVRMMTADPATDALMTVADDGTFTEYALSTGAVRKTGRIEPPEAAAEEESVGLRVLGNRLTVFSLHYGPHEATVKGQGYDRATLEPLAQAPADLLIGTDECGPVLCGFDFGKLSILDRDTHAVLWQANAEPAIWTTSGLLAGDGALRLVDPRTGRSLLDAAGWQRVHHRRRFPDDHGHAVLIRPVDHRTYIGHLTPQGIRVLGSVPRPLSECQSDQDLLICVAPGIGAEVWRLDLRG